MVLPTFLTVCLRIRLELEQAKPRNMRPKVLKDFCESTSLHGYSYLTADSVLSKVVWAIIILIATVAGLYFIAINTRDYMKASIVTNIESTSEKLHVSNHEVIYKIPFL